MPYYIGEYENIRNGRRPLFRPVSGDQPGWSAIDLRPDCSRLDGGGLNACLLWLPYRSGDRRLLLVSEEKRELIGRAARRRLLRRLGLCEVDERRFDLVCRDILMKPPGHAWNALQATGDRVVAYLNGELFSLPVFQGGVVNTDNFDRANSASLGANWTEWGDASLEILNNECANQTNGTVGKAAHVTQVATADQYAQCVVNSSAVAGTNIAVVMVRIENSLTVDEFYFASVDADTAAGLPHEIRKIVAGVDTILLTSATAYTVGEVLRVEASGTSIGCKKDGAYVSGTNPVTDSSIAGDANHRRVGIRSALFFAGVTRMNDWEGGDYAVGTPQTVTAADDINAD